MPESWSHLCCLSPPCAPQPGHSRSGDAASLLDCTSVQLSLCPGSVSVLTHHSGTVFWQLCLLLAPSPHGHTLPLSLQYIPNMGGIMSLLNWKSFHCSPFPPMTFSFPNRKLTRLCPCLGFPFAFQSPSYVPASPSTCWPPGCFPALLRPRALRPTVLLLMPYLYEEALLQEQMSAELASLWKALVEISTQPPCTTALPTAQHIYLLHQK